MKQYRLIMTTKDTRLLQLNQSLAPHASCKTTAYPESAGPALAIGQRHTQNLTAAQH
jgi:hypothetical protein